MTYVCYDVAVSCAAPLGALWLMAHRRHRPLLARFAPPLPPFERRPLWVQACSVGEVGTARPLIRAFHERHPDVPVLLTASTVTGHALAQSLGGGVDVAWFPFDHKTVVRRFLRRARPRALALIETEIWPNVLRETRRYGVPVVLLNGRLSDKHHPRYVRWRRFLRPVFEQISAAGMQNQEYADRLAALGVARPAIHVTGNTKFDGVRTALEPGACAAIRDENGFGPEDPVLVFGSTRPGDEALAAQCWQALRDEVPGLRLVVAPRHLERLDEALAPFDEPVLRRSEVRQGQRPAGQRVFVLDTVGELVGFYAVATVAVVGGSFYAGVNGHNPLEPAALGVPTVFGPYMRNFIDPARVLTEQDGARQVDGPEDLLPALRHLLADVDARSPLAARGRAAVMANRGAVDRCLDLLDAVLGKDEG